MVEEGEGGGSEADGVFALDTDDWPTRGRWAWLHSLRVLDPAPDPAIDALVDLASRLTDGPVSLWLRDGAALAHARGSGADATATVVPVELRGLRVGELRTGPTDDEVVLEGIAAEIAVVLDERWRRARREQGRPVGVLVVDGDLHITWTSPELDELAGGGLDAVLGESSLEIFAVDDRDDAVPVIESVSGGRGRTSSTPIRLRVLGQEPRHFEAQAVNCLDDPDVAAMVFVIKPAAASMDESSMLADQIWVLNRVSAGRALDEALERVVSLVERRGGGANGLIFGLNQTGTRLEVLASTAFPEPALERLRSTGIGAQEPGGGSCVHHEMAQFVSDIRQDERWAAHGAVVDEGFRACWSMPITSMTSWRLLGSIDLYLREPGQPNDTDTRVLVMAARLAAMAIDQDEHERALRHAATHDPLTGLPNRTLFAERLDAAAPDGHLAVLFIDLDRFKLVNDTLGHAFGDELLCAVADRLAAEVPAPATVARFGGDEFTVLLPKVERMADAVDEAERVLAVLRQPYELRGQRVAIRASAGVAVVSEVDGGSSDPGSLVRDADVALYHAKDRGRARVEAFDGRILAAAQRRLDVERQLLDSLDAGLVTVAFQPSVRLADGAVVGIEALARCRTVTGDVLPPITFIPVAEETGLIPRVFDVVLADACGWANRWNEGRDEPLVVWVNVSPQQLGSPDLLRQVQDAFDETGVVPATIGFEVTEAGILADPDEARDRLRALVDLGAHVALDDFGTGYSSLSHLQELPVDTVKLDRSFVVRAEADPRSAAIVGGVVALAEAMGLRCVAEGVETEDELRVVAELGCDIVQGFVYSRPVTAAALTDWMATTPPRN